MARYGSMAVDKGGAGLLPLAGGGVEGTETPVAMRRERAHAEFLCQRQSLVVAGFGLRHVRWITTHGNLEEQPSAGSWMTWP